jgi:hypothetical protein
MAYVEESAFGQIPYVTRAGTYTAVDAGTTITAAASGNKFAGLVAGHSITLNGGTLDGEVRNVVSVNTSADPHVLTLDGVNFSSDTLTSITVPPTMRAVTYKGGGLGTTVERDEEAGAVIQGNLRYGHGKITGMGTELSVEGNLSLIRQFYDWTPGVMTNNDGWVAQSSALRSVSFSVVAGPPDTYWLTCATDGWLDGILPGHFVMLSGMTTANSNYAVNNVPMLVVNKNTQSAGAHKIQVACGIAMSAEAGVSVTVKRAKTLRDSNTYKSFMFAQSDEGTMFERVNGVLVSGLEVSCEKKGTATANFTMTPAADYDFNPKSTDTHSGAPYYGLLESLELGDTFVGANMIWRFDSGIMAIMSGSWKVEDRHEAVEETKAGEGADSCANTAGYYPSNFFLKHMKLTGAAKMLFTSTGLYEKFRNDCTGRVDLKLQEKNCDGCGKQIVFSAPSVKFTNVKPGTGALDAAREADAEWQAAEWVFTDADSAEHRFCGQISVFE